MANPIRFLFTASTKALDAGVDQSERVVKRFADTAEKSGRRVDSAFESTAGHADNIASKGSQAAGGLSGLGSVAQLAGGQVGLLGGAMVTASVAAQAAADAGDLLNVVTESTIGKKLAEKAATAGSTVVTIASTAATRGAAIATRLLGLAMDSLPIIAIVAGVILLVTALVLAYRRSTVFRTIVNGVFASVAGVVRGFVGFFTRTIPDAVGRVVGFVKARWPVILAIMAGPIGLLVLAIARNFDKVRDLFGDVVGFIAGIPGRIGGLAGRFVDAGARLIGALLDGLSHLAGGIGNVATAIVDSIIDKLNSILPHTLSINKGPIHVSVPLFPTIPRLAQGGITTGPMLALIGDNPSGREAVIPLDQGETLGGHRTYNITVNAPVGADPYTIGETIAGYIEEFEAGRREIG